MVGDDVKKVLDSCQSVLVTCHFILSCKAIHLQQSKPSINIPSIAVYQTPIGAGLWVSELLVVIHRNQPFEHVSRHLSNSQQEP